MIDETIPLANSKVLYDTLLEAAGYTVTKTTVHPGGETQWHHHTSVHDRFVVVSGTLTVVTKIGNQTQNMQVEDYCSIEPSTVHHVKNLGEVDAVYIMVQSGGQRDIVLADES